jgi:tetratricopeptide (TPR) repeat protein
MPNVRPIIDVWPENRCHVETGGAMTSRRLRFFLVSVTILVAALLIVLGWAELNLALANRALSHHDGRSAMRYLSRTPRGLTRPAPYHLAAARAARLLEVFELAEDHFSEYRRRAGGSTDEGTLEWALLRAQRGEVEPVEAFLRKQVDQRHPRSSWILEAMARGYLRLHRRLDAMNCVRIWLERQPDAIRPVMLRGLIHYRANAFSRAVEDLRQVVEREPENDEARRLLANALIENSQAPEAVPHLELLSERYPDDWDVQVKLAFAWNMLGRSADALALLDRVLTAQPNFGPALSARGQLEMQVHGNPEGAEVWLRKALVINPSDRQTHYALYQSLLQQGRDQEAEIQHKNLLRIEAAITRMIDIANRLLPKNPRDAKLAYELGSIMMSLGYYENGVSWLLKALEYDPLLDSAHRDLADYYEKQGNLPAANYHRERMRSSPNQP